MLQSLKIRACRTHACPLATLSAMVLLCVFSATARPQTAQPGAAPAPAGSQRATQFDSLSRRALEALDADRLQDAIPLLRKALLLNPRWAEGWWSLGTAYYDQERYAEAELAFQRVVAIDPKHGTAHALLGLCQFELGDDKAALLNIEMAKDLGTDLDPQLRTVVFFHEGILLQRAGRFVAAEMPFASLCLGGTDSVDVVRAFGMAALRMTGRQFPPPGSVAAIVAEQVGRSACSAAHKDFDDARQRLASVTAAYPHFPYVHYAFGRVLIDAGDIPGAVAEFKREIEEGHDRVLPMLQIAACEYKVDSAAGLPYAEQAVALAPQLPFAHYLLGLLLENTGAEARAVPELEIARRAFPHDRKVLWSLASAYARTGRAQEAAKARAAMVRLERDAASHPENLAGDSANSPIDVTDAAAQGPQR